MGRETKLTNLWPDSSRKKETHQGKKRNQINKIRSEKGEVTTDNAEIQRMIRDYYEQLYGNGTPLQYSCLENSMDGGP